ncbi:MAG TPA: DUF6457 domain-containing protein [Micromonosporaceae bacterium]|jgi:hypothetical protein|nr:DUF6457 domain-containing protein [Micromonosporaceae bacterium]
MNALDEWTDAVRGALHLDPIEPKLVLDLARDVAHGVLRPAAPLTAYLVGIAVGRGVEPREAVAAVEALIAGWPSPDTSDERDNRAS